MNRLLLTVGRKSCPFGCLYCFTDFTQYERPLSIDEVDRGSPLLKDVDVVYPACDVDLFALRQWPRILRRAASLGPSISISTKAALDLDAVARIGALARSVEARGEMLKVAVSISTSTRIAEFEPQAPSYAERLRTLELLASAGVPTALVLRPLLVDVAPSEYGSILIDAAPFVQHVLTGPEHLDDDGNHMRHRALAPHPRPQRRAIPWAVNSPHWSSRKAPAQERAVRREARQLGIDVFDTDLALMAALMRRRGRLGDAAASA